MENKLKIIQFIEDHNVRITKAEFCKICPERYYDIANEYDVHFSITIKMEDSISFDAYCTVDFTFIEQWLKDHKIKIKYPEVTYLLKL